MVVPFVYKERFYGRVINTPLVTPLEPAPEGAERPPCPPVGPAEERGAWAELDWSNHNEAVYQRDMANRRVVDIAQPPPHRVFGWGC
eukprot:1014591-Prorocentrum_minimum.AAC.1